MEMRNFSPFFTEKILPEVMKPKGNWVTDGPYKVRVIHREIITVEDVAHADTKLRIPVKKNSHSDLCFSNVFFFLFIYSSERRKPL